MPMKNPPHPGHSIKAACLEPLELSVPEGAQVLGVTRHTLSRVINWALGIWAGGAIRQGRAGGAAAGPCSGHWAWRGYRRVTGLGPRSAMWRGGLVGVKPILRLVDGSIGLIGRPRTRRRAMDRLVSLAAAHLGGKRGRIAVMHANAPERAGELAERLRAELDPAELFVTEFTPVIGAHVGPGLVGFALHAAEG